MKIGLSFPETKIKHKGVQNAQHKINRFVHLFSHQHLSLSFSLPSEIWVLTCSSVGRLSSLWIHCSIALAHKYQRAHRVLIKGFSREHFSAS
jgi:hypothetical protein